MIHFLKLKNMNEKNRPNFNNFPYGFSVGLSKIKVKVLVRLDASTQTLLKISSKF